MMSSEPAVGTDPRTLIDPTPSLVRTFFVVVLRLSFPPRESWTRDITEESKILLSNILFEITTLKFVDNKPSDKHSWYYDCPRFHADRE